MKYHSKNTVKISACHVQRGIGEENIVLLFKRKRNLSNHVETL